MRRKFREKLSREDAAEVNYFRLNPPQSVRDLAERLGVGVIEENLDDHQHGFLDYRADLGTKSGYVIFINKNLSTDQKRWAVAHELGHYFLHRDKRQGTFDTQIHLQNSRDAYWLLEDEEAEAERFAEDLFFGGGALEAFVTLHGLNAEKLAEKVFGVPTEKMRLAIVFYQKYKGLKE